MLSVGCYYSRKFITEPLRATTESQSAQRTHRDFFGRGFEAVSSFAISAGPRASRARQPTLAVDQAIGLAKLVYGRASWASTWARVPAWALPPRGR